MRIQANLAALNTHNRMKANQTNLSKTLEKLSSGYQINRAADDAAGLTISENMRAQIRGLMRANLNAQDGLSYVETSDAVMQEAVQTVQRMRELTIQSLNDTLTKEDRMTIQKELNALKESINSMSEDTRYNGSLKAVETYHVDHAMLEGIRRFDGPVLIEPGINDALSFSANGETVSIAIPLGKYDSIEELADTMDTLLAGKKPTIVLSITDNRCLAAQVDQSLEIAQIKGAGSSLFFDYEIGNKPGMIIGTTDFSTGNGKLRITAGQNDKLSLYIGPTNRIQMTFPPGDYTRDEVIDFMNGYLQGTGAEAFAYGDKNISIASDTFSVTGLNGNMFKVDVHTSVLYDNVFYGNVSKSRSSFYGAAQIGSTVTLPDDSSFLISGRTRDNMPLDLTINLVGTGEGPKTFTQGELVQHIQNQVDAANLDVTVSIQSNRLHFQSNFWGANRNVAYRSSSSDDVAMALFNKITMLENPSSITQGADVAANVRGNYKDRSAMDITAANNELKVNVGGQPVTIMLDVDTQYTPQAMRDFLNQKFSDLGLNVNVSTAQYGAQTAFHLSSSTASIKLETSSALDTLFGGQAVQSARPTQGYDGPPVYPQEGTVGPPEIEKFPAKVLGVPVLSNSISVTEDDKTIRFTLNGTAHAIELTAGNYTQESFAQHVNVKLTGVGITASIENNRLLLTTESKGKGITLSNVSGVGMDLVQYSSLPLNTALTSQSIATVTGSITLGTKTLQAGSNTMTFDFLDQGTYVPVSLTIQPGSYSKDEMVTKLNDALNTLNLASKLKFQLSNGNMQLTALHAGSQNRINGLSGELYKDLFERTEHLSSPNNLAGYTSRQIEAYTVGRQELDSITEIFPSTNDVLTFDVAYRGSKHTIDVRIPPGSYTGNELATVFNQSMRQALQQKQLPEDLLVAQIWAPNSGQNVSNANKFVLTAPSKNDGRNDTGQTIIDGVRGSAAYSIFYQSNGVPKPSYVTGMKDLSNGLTITAGVNDQLSVDVNNQTYPLTFPPGEYDSETLLNVINNELSTKNTGLIASYSTGFLRLSYKENGIVPIDGFTGNARSSLFFNVAAKAAPDSLTLHIGANSTQNMKLQQAAFSDRMLGISTLYVGTRQSGEKALVRLDRAVGMLTDQLSTLGAVQNRLQHVLGVNQNTAENTTAAESKLRDADMAKEMMHYVKQNILSQSMQSMLSQAVKSPELVLQLVSGK